MRAADLKAVIKFCLFYVFWQMLTMNILDWIEWLWDHFSEVLILQLCHEKLLLRKSVKEDFNYFQTIL